MKRDQRLSKGVTLAGIIGLAGLYGCDGSSNSSNSSDGRKVVATDSGVATEMAMTTSPSSPQILQVNLADNALGLYVASDLNTDFGEVDNWNDGIDEGRVSIIEEAGDRRMRVSYPDAQFGPKETGAQFKVKTAAQAQLCVSYKLQLQSDFDFGKGGKLPGLAGGVANTGSKSNAPNGIDGYSSRVMWREGGVLHQYSYLFAVEAGGSPVAQHYMPWQLPEGGDVVLTAGTAHQIETCATMNSVAQGLAAFDGKLQSWFDSQKVLDVTVAYRNDISLRSDIFYFSTFFGGGDASWNSPKGQTIDFWDIKISSEPVTVTAE